MNIALINYYFVKIKQLIKVFLYIYRICRMFQRCFSYIIYELDTKTEA